MNQQPRIPINLINHIILMMCLMMNSKIIFSFHENKKTYRIELHWRYNKSNKEFIRMNATLLICLLKKQNEGIRTCTICPIDFRNNIMKHLIKAKYIDSLTSDEITPHLFDASIVILPTIID